MYSAVVSGTPLPDVESLVANRLVDPLPSSSTPTPTRPPPTTPAVTPQRGPINGAYAERWVSCHLAVRVQAEVSAGRDHELGPTATGCVVAEIELARARRATADCDGHVGHRPADARHVRRGRVL